MNASVNEADPSLLPDDEPSTNYAEISPSNVLICDRNFEQTSAAFLESNNKTVKFPLHNVELKVSVKKKLKLKAIIMPFCYYIKLFYVTISFMCNSTMRLLGSLFDLPIIGKILEGLSPLTSKKLIKYMFIVIGLFILIVHGRKKDTEHGYKVERLFTSFSLIKDYYHGELNLLKEHLLLSDYTFVLYYAPWDRDSQELRSHFLKVASYHHEQVTFAAINCWLPKTECRTQYALREFPLLVLHIRMPTNDDTLNIPYNGPYNCHYLTRFITNSLKPFTHITSKEDLVAVQLQSKAVVTGFFNPKLDSAAFLAFYYSSLIRLQFEETKDVSFGIITEPRMANYLFDKKAVLHLLLWNETLIYPEKQISNFKNITQWLNKNLNDIVNWVPLDNRKSFFLSDSLNKGSILLLFVPNNPYFNANNYLLLLKSIALEYFNCQNSKSIFLEPLINDQKRESEKICKNFLKDQILYHSTFTQSLDSHENLPSSLCENFPIDNFCTSPKSLFVDIWDSLFQSVDGFPILSLDLYTKEYTDSCSCRGNSCHKNQSISYKSIASKTDLPKQKYSMHSGPIEDEKVARLEESVYEKHCKMLYFGQSLPYPLPAFEFSNLSISGLSCQTNKTLTFLVLDSSIDATYATNLGVNISFPSNVTGAVIIDPITEEYYQLDEPLSRQNLASFIHNYTNDLLNRHVISRDPPIDGSPCTIHESCIIELNANSYIAHTETSNEAYIVMHYSSSCGACSSIGPTFLLSASRAAAIPDLKFARIDVSKNVLPWHLTFAELPTIIFYPAERKSETVIFNNEKPFTYDNLMFFIISSIEIRHQRKLVADMCDSNCQKFFQHSGLHVYSLMKHKYASLLLKFKARLYITNYLKLNSNINVQTKRDFSNLTKLLSNRLYSIRTNLAKLKKLYNQFENVPNFINFYSYVNYQS